jgi:hypothetical protein
MSAFYSKPDKKSAGQRTIGHNSTGSPLVALLGLFILLGITGCAAIPSPTLAPTDSPTVFVPTFTPTLTQTIPSPPTATPTATPTQAAGSITAICSPLSGIDLEDLHSITSQGFTPPTPFLDDGHPAVDLAFFTFENLPSMMGHPVQSILPGKVVLAVEDRFPYGSMILIETPLQWISAELLPPVVIPTPIPLENINQFNPCTNNPLFESIPPISMAEDSKSVYVLYSHLLEKPPYDPGDEIACGQVIGAVGLTGNTVAEHLHLEIRIGPSEARFGTIAMYKPEATVEERYNYCIWSTSGRFQPVNPTLFWETNP